MTKGTSGPAPSFSQANSGPQEVPRQEPGPSRHQQLLWLTAASKSILLFSCLTGIWPSSLPCTPPAPRSLKHEGQSLCATGGLVPHPRPGYKGATHSPVCCVVGTRPSCEAAACFILWARRAGRTHSRAFLTWIRFSVRVLFRSNQLVSNQKAPGPASSLLTVLGAVLSILPSG